MKTRENIAIYSKHPFFAVESKALLKLQRWAIYLSFAAILIGVLVLTGWQFDISFLKRPVAELTAMNPTTAVSFILCGISVVLLTGSAVSSKHERAGKMIAGIITIIGLMRFVSPLVNSAYGIDTILFHDLLEEDTRGNSSNRMSLNTAFTFVITGLGLLVMNTETRNKRMPAHFIAIFIILAAIISILGYLYKIKLFYGSFLHIPMAVHTAIGFLFIALAILFANPNKGLTKEMTSRFSGSFIARFLIPVSIIVPLLLGLIYLQGVWNADFSMELGTGFFALSVILIFLSLTWFIVVTLNKRDLQKAEADLALLKFNETLEQRIQERTETIDRSEKQYRYLFKNNPMPMWVIDLDNFKFLDVNEMALFQYGYSREEFLSMTALDIRPESDKDMFIRADHSYETNSRNYNRGIWNHVKKDGSIIQVEVIAHEILFEGKKARLILSNDVTEQKQAEKKIIASEKQFRTTLDNMLEGAQIIGFDWKYIYINDSLAKHAKYNRDEMIGYTVMEKFPGIEHTEIFKVYQRCFDERVSIHLENEFNFPDGTVGCFELSFQPIPEGIFILSIDITERKNAEAAIVRAEANYREIFDKASDGIYVHDIPGGTIIDTNQRAAEITGYSKEEILTIWAKKFVTGSKENNINPASIHLQKAATGEPQLFEWLSRKKDGTYTWLEVNLKKATIAGHERILSFFREINDRKKALEEVEKLNQELEQKVTVRTQQLKRTNEELEAFSYSVSHDLRAPLRAIIGFSTILQEDYINNLDDEAKRITNVIISNTKKMGQLIDDLLTFSRMGRQNILESDVNNNELVQEIIEELDKKEDRSKKIKWTVHNLPPVKADMNIMRQVWINLISNAVKYSEKVAEPCIEIGASENETEAIFFVKDNGVGFDEKYKDKLFRVFQRLHTSEDFEGTGIGLAIVEKIISRHGGKVWAHAEVDKGACFYFSLPVTANKEQLTQTDTI